jgi:hypothetical protein
MASIVKLILEPKKNGTAKLTMDEKELCTWYITDYNQRDNFIFLYDENHILIGDVCIDNIEVECD